MSIMPERTFYIETHGCQMNIYDSRFVTDLLEANGYRQVVKPGDASLVLINTCSVRDRAERKALSRLRELSARKRVDRNLRIGIMGCMAQRLGQSLVEIAGPVDLVVGPDCYADLPALIDRTYGNGPAVVAVRQDPACLYTLRPRRYDGITAFVTIMRGCDNFCSYCIVPYVRGRERSKNHREVLDEIKNLADLGVKEVTLIGQNVDSYVNEGVDFARLLEMVNEVIGLERIRFTTSHPKDLTERVIANIRDLDKVCEHLHLPIQSGSDRILSLMNRGYTYGDFKDLVLRARDAVPGLAVSTDIMVGFPTESLSDHDATLTAMREMMFESAFMFRYSVREATQASRLEDDVEESEKLRRLKQVIEIENGIVDEKKRALVGRQVDILIDGVSSKEPDFMLGRTRKNWLAKIPKKGVRKGETVRARITGATRWMLTCQESVRKAGI